MESKTPLAADLAKTLEMCGRLGPEHAPLTECARRIESALAMAEEALNDAPTEWGEAPWKKGGA